MKEKDFAAPGNSQALDSYLGLTDSARAAAESAAMPANGPDAALLARCDAVMALTPRLADAPDIAWAFAEAREIARSAPRRRERGAPWYRLPSLAWSVAGVASVAFLALLVATRWPDGLTPTGAESATVAAVDSPAYLAMPPGVEDLIARIDPVVLIANQMPVDGRSIALLPFAEQMTAVDRDDIRAVAATADAIHASLVRQLRAIPGIYVAEETSAAAYAESGASPEEIARYLGVRGVVRGSIRSDGRLVSLDLRFTDASREGRAISKSFAGPVEQIAMLETDVTTSLLDALGTASTWSQ